MNGRKDMGVLVKGSAWNGIKGVCFFFFFFV